MTKNVLFVCHCLRTLSGVLGGVWLLFKVLSCLESSGRVVGFISAHFRVYTTEMERVITKNVGSWGEL